VGECHHEAAAGVGVPGLLGEGVAELALGGLQRSGAEVRVGERYGERRPLPVRVKGAALHGWARHGRRAALAQAAQREVEPAQQALLRFGASGLARRRSFDQLTFRHVAPHGLRESSGTA
jgi:hypothetical protein